MKSFLNMVYLLVGVSVCSFLYLLISYDSTSTEEIEAEKIGWCGTTGIQIHSNYGDVREGKKLFRNNCAECHDKSMTRDMTGPALYGSLDKWNRDSIQLQLYFSNSPAYLDSSNSPRLIELRETWKPTVSHKYQLSMQEVKDVMSYVEGKKEQ